MINFLHTMAATTREAPLSEVRRAEVKATAERYILPPRVLSEYQSPATIDLKARENAHQFRPGADFALTTFDGQLAMVPPWHPAFRQTPEVHHGGDYGSGIFEGLSLMPVVENNQIVGANIILLEPRMERLKRSLANRGLSEKVSVEEMRQAIIDLATIESNLALIDENGHPSRAYIRPSIRPGDGPLGVGIKDSHIIQKDAVIFNWPEYLDVEKAMNEGLTVVMSPDFQRTEPINGKFASSYGRAGVISKQVREMGGDEAIFFAPFSVVDGKEVYTYGQAGEKERELLAKHGALADGPGEEVFAISGNTIIYPPREKVNRLGGTTLDHIVKYMAKDLGFNVEERAFTLEDIRTGKVDSLLFAGNAATVMPIGRILVYQNEIGKMGDKPEELNLPVTEQAKQLAIRYREEVSGQTPSSDPNLLFPVDIREGRVMEEVLRLAYEKWFK